MHKSVHKLMANFVCLRFSAKQICDKSDLQELRDTQQRQNRKVLLAGLYADTLLG